MIFKQIWLNSFGKKKSSFFLYYLQWVKYTRFCQFTPISIIMWYKHKLYALLMHVSDMLDEDIARKCPLFLWLRLFTADIFFIFLQQHRLVGFLVWPQGGSITIQWTVIVWLCWFKVYNIKKDTKVAVEIYVAF